MKQEELSPPLQHPQKEDQEEALSGKTFCLRKIRMKRKCKRRKDGYKDSGKKGSQYW